MPEVSSSWSPAKKLGLLLVDLAAIGAGTATVLAFGARLHWLCDLATHMCAQVAAALALAGVCYAATRRWKSLAFSVVAALPNLWGLAPFYLPPTEEPTPSAPSLKLVSVNLYAYSREYDRVSRYLRETSPDIAVFVEYTHAWRHGLEAMATEFTHVYHFPRADPFGVAIYSRLPLDDVRLEMSPHEMSFLRAKATLGSRTVTIIVVHPAPPMGQAYWRSRNDDLRFVADLARGAPGPKVVVGDLNVTSWSPFFHDLIESTGLRDTRLGRGLQSTWPTHFPLPLRIAIDHCLVSSEIGIVERRVGPDVGSDHLPIEARLSIDR